MDRARQFIQSKVGRSIAIVAVMAALVAGVDAVINAIRGDTPATARSAMYVCTETGRRFSHENKVGDVPPIYSPHSKKNTGLRAEPCFWTASGEPKQDPTWVLLNESVRKPGPTFCPDCDRLVVGHNPEPSLGAHLPPTREEYAIRRPTRTNRTERADAMVAPRRDR